LTVAICAYPGGGCAGFGGFFFLVAGASLSFGCAGGEGFDFEAAAAVLGVLSAGQLPPQPQSAETKPQSDMFRLVSVFGKNPTAAVPALLTMPSPQPAMLRVFSPCSCAIDVPS
jgi:hypothetical protein